MVKNNVEVAKKAAEYLIRLEQKEVTPDEAKTASALLNVIHKASIIELMKLKMGVELLPHEEESESGKRFIKKVS